MSSDITALVKKYIETWNILDADQRRAAIDALFTEDVEYVDNNVQIEGALLSTTTSRRRRRSSPARSSRSPAR